MRFNVDNVDRYMGQKEISFIDAENICQISGVIHKQICNAFLEQEQKENMAGET